MNVVQSINETKCFSCGAVVENVDGPIHRYMHSSPGCWKAYGNVLGREYSDAMYAQNHRLTVDTYAVQHPGKPSPQSIQSIAVHLASFYMIFERSLAVHEATHFIQKLAQHKSAFFWLEPPTDLYDGTVTDVLAAKDAKGHTDTVMQWARSTWLDWKDHHDQVKRWAELCV